MLVFAYDGSINGDWVSRYAVRMALRAERGTLHAVHVEDGGVAPAELTQKLDRVRRECEEAGAGFTSQTLPLRGTVDRTLCEAVEHGAGSFLVCGTRARSGARGYLAGTVSERLLRAHPCHVAALRVVQPGLLGAPQRLLLPMAGHPRGIDSATPLLRLLAPDVRQAHVLRVMSVRRGTFRRLSTDTLRRLRRRGREYVQHVEDQIVARVGLDPKTLDAFVRVSDDWANQIVIHASQYKSQLICVGASERTLAERFFYGNPLERLLRNAPCDVAVYRGVT
jgi:nucleotide-binding universal stress UspA family protein